MLSLVRIVSKMDEDFDIRKYKDYDAIIGAKTEPTEYRLFHLNNFGVKTILGKIIPRSKTVIILPAFRDYIKLTNADIQNKLRLYIITLLNVNSNIDLIITNRSENTPESLTEDKYPGKNIKDIDVSKYPQSNVPCMDLEIVHNKLKETVKNQHSVMGKIIFIYDNDELFDFIKSENDVNKLKLPDIHSKLYYSKDKFNKNEWITLSTLNFANIYLDLLKNRKVFYIIGYNSKDSVGHAVVITLEFIEDKKILIELVDSEDTSNSFNIIFWSKQLMIYLIANENTVIFKTTKDEAYMPQSLIIFNKINQEGFDLQANLELLSTQGTCSLFSFYYIWLRIKNKDTSGSIIRKYIVKMSLSDLEKKINKISSYITGDFEDYELL